MKSCGQRKEYLVTLLPIIVSAALIACVCLTPALGRVGYAAAAVLMPQRALTSVENRFRAKACQTVHATVQSLPASDSASLQPDVQVSTLTQVPPDVTALITKYTAAFKEQTKAGDIVEITYGKKGATSIFENVLVRNTTDTKSLNIEKVLSQRPDIHITDLTQPTVLIFHTHTSEGYEYFERDWFANEHNGRSDNAGENIVRVGSEIAKYLTEAGITVIHDKQVHDVSYSEAYAHSGVNVKKYLEQYPSIQVVLDVHRDAIHQSNGSKVKPVATINGKKAAQIMIITGAEEGKVTEFPDWEYNLCFALKLQQRCETMYPGLMRPVLFSPRKYNMHMSHCNVLLEMGSDVNTLDEAVYSGRLVASALADMLRGYAEDEKDS